MANVTTDCQTLSTNQLYQGDCVELLKQIEPGSVDLVFADPPFNIGYEYDVHEDERGADEYLGWCEDWITGIRKCLKPNGTFWRKKGTQCCVPFLPPLGQ